MVKYIKFQVEDKSIGITLNDSRTSQKIYKNLPINGLAQVWGNEIYFSIPIHQDLENGKEELDVGTVAYWPPGNAFCIFFGKTPESNSEKPRAVSPVTVIGKITDSNDVNYLKKVKQGQKIALKPEQKNTS